jgi:hypothetical protein
MRTSELDLAEQEWRESWEPTLPLTASRGSTKSVVPSQRFAQVWSHTERRLEYMVRLLSWALNGRAEKVRTAELQKALEKFDRLTIEVTSMIGLNRR